MSDLAKPKVEKYRPHDLGSLILQDWVRKYIQKLFDTSTLPASFTLEGPPGTGKTTLAYMIAEHFLGHEIVYGANYDDFIELNAGDDRGVDAMRVLKSFAETSTGKVRFIFLDEGDNLTTTAQGALKALMEKNRKNTIWILAGNDFSGTDPAIVSRGTHIVMLPIPPRMALERVKKICRAEGVIISDTLLLKVIDFYNGDMRMVINDGIEKMPVGVEVTELDLGWIIPTVEVELVGKCLGLPLQGAVQAFSDARAEKYVDPRAFLSVLFEKCGMKYPAEFARVDARIKKGADPLIQVIYLLSVVKGAAKK